MAPAQALVGHAPTSALAGAVAVQLLSLEVAGSEAARAALVRHVPTRTINAPTSLLTPGFVNAHTHLDLTHVPLIPFDASAGFLSFVRHVLGHRLEDSEAIFASVAEGVRLSRAGGVVAVGDIAGVAGGVASSFAAEALAATGMLGVSYIEFFGFGAGEAAGTQAAAAALARACALRDGAKQSGMPWQNRIGLSPHAPYSASPEAFSFAAQLSTQFASRDQFVANQSLPLCTHLAENPEEREFIARGTGPFRELHERLGWWSDTTSRLIGKGQSPVAFLSPVLDRSPYLLAHVNDVTDAEIAQLASQRASVVYNPRSSAYFLNHEHFGPHRYKAMLAAGISVALGTDSVINLPSHTVDKARGALSTLDEARMLHARDGTDPIVLLKMLTSFGATALALPQDWFTFAQRGERAGSNAIKAGLVLTDLGLGEVGLREVGTAKQVSQSSSHEPAHSTAAGFWASKLLESTSMPALFTP